MYIYSFVGAQINITVTNSTFTNNTISGNHHGCTGGLLVESSNGANIIITNSAFTDNTVGYYGAYTPLWVYIPI